MARTSHIERHTAETRIDAQLNLDGNGLAEIQSGIGFFDHMLTLFCVHGRGCRTGFGRGPFLGPGEPNGHPALRVCRDAHGRDPGQSGD